MQKGGNKLYSFGFNAFQQTTGAENNDTAATKVSTYHKNIKQVLYTSWETTILLGDADDLVVWGFKPEWFEKVESLAKEKQVKSIFGDPNIVLGMLDQEGSISYATADATVKEKYKAVEQVAYCSSLNSIFTLSKDGSIYQINIKDSLETNIFDSAPTVKKLCASNTHALFITDDPYTPIYGFGSNRFSQLGMDYHEEQEMTKLKAIEYFSGGLGGKATDIACGLFHSAVIIEDDLYTFGFNKDGRLGWGLDNDEDEDDIISLAQFLGENNQSVEVHAFKVVCGSSHTLVLDNRGNLWSCGSNKYGQLGRDLTDENEDHDSYFRKCTSFDTNQEKIIDIYAGRWNSFYLTAASL